MGWLDRIRGRSAARNEAQFQDLAVAVARRTPGVRAARPHPDEALALEVEFDREGDGESLVRLQRPWALSQGKSRRVQKGAVAAWLNSFVARLDRPASWDEARPRLFLALRSASGMLGTFADIVPIAERVPGGLHLVLYLDLESSMSPVNKSELVRWDVSREAAWDAALVNTERLAPKVEVSDTGGLYRIEGGQIDAASFLMAPGWLRSVAGSGQVIAWSADRDWVNVLVHGRDEAWPELTPSLVELARSEWAQSESPLSPLFYRLDGDRVVLVEPDSDHPASASLEVSRLLFQQAQYTDQKAALDQRHAEEGVDLWVGNLMLHEVQGHPRSLAVWTDECDSLLPAADVLCFVRAEGGEPFELPMAAVVEAAGLEPVEGLSPVRYRVARWPDRAVLETLGAPRT